MKSEEFSQILQRIMNSYINGMIDNEQVIQELLKLAVALFSESSCFLQETDV